jgi:hypothetical protein
MAELNLDDGDYLMSAAELLAGLQEQGNSPLNNAWVASRGFPPVASAGINPAEYFAVYNNGDLFSELRAQLGAPMLRPSPDFNRAAAPGIAAAPSFHPTLDVVFRS